MKKFTFKKILASFIILSFSGAAEVSAQCQFPSVPIYSQNFGAGTRPATSPLTTFQVPELNYQGTGNMDPEKIYTVTPTSNLHSNPNAWWTVSDHTGNTNGMMMLVNDREPAGIIYMDGDVSTKFGQSNLYYLSAWVMNILKPGVCTASGNNPDIKIYLTVDAKIGGVWNNIVTSPTFTYPSPIAAPDWKKIGINFITPAVAFDSLRFAINNESIVLCGNDYVLDDIQITGCANNIPLPVTLTNFTATYKNGVTILNWEVENEINFSHYEIERKAASAGSYNEVARKELNINSSNKSSYIVNDNISNVTDNKFLYRLKMVDVDGKFKYSNEILVSKEGGSIKGIRISPNPVVNSDMVTVRFDAAAKATVDFKVMDLSGRVILKQQNRVEEGANSVSLTNLKSLQSGTYILQMNDGVNIQTTKFIIAK